MRERKIRIWDGKQMWYSGQTSPIVEVAITGQGIIANAWSQGGEHLLQIEVIDAMDFTGLHDKNNNPIYEGDIVEADGMESVLVYDYSQARRFVDSNIKDERKWEHRRSNYIVYWQDNFSQFNFKPVIPGHSINTDIGKRNYEIVGNIYESPLIKIT